MSAQNAASGASTQGASRAEGEAKKESSSGPTNMLSTDESTAELRWAQWTIIGKIRSKRILCANLFIYVSSLSSSIAKLRSLLTKIGESTDEINKMSIESELTIREHFDSLRLQVDIARETALENIHNTSNTLMTEIEAYERECLSGWTSVRGPTDNIAKDVSKRMRAFLDEQHAFLQRVQASDTHMILLTVSVWLWKFYS